MQVLLVISTFPDAPAAGRIARELVEGRLAACANIMPSVQSIYRWEGKVEEAAETMVFFKTTEDRLAQLRATLHSLHPYEVPEITAFRVAEGLPEYLDWVSANCV